LVLLLSVLSLSLLLLLLLLGGARFTNSVIKHFPLQLNSP
jgi:hypothetical protein